MPIVLPKLPDPDLDERARIVSSPSIERNQASSTSGAKYHIRPRLSAAHCSIM